VTEPALHRHRDFRLLLVGQTTSQFGTQVSGIAIPLLAVVVLHAGPFEIGLLGVASTIAFATIGLPAGAWLDGRRLRPVLVTADVVRALLLASIPVAALLGTLSIAHLLVVSLLVGVARVFFDLGQQSYVPALIGRGRVLAGNSALEFVRSAGQIAGPGVGGVLVSLLGAATVVLVDAVTFAVSALSLLAIRTSEAPPVHDQDRPHMGIRIAEGLRFVIGNRVLRALGIASALSNLAFAVASSVNVVFMVRVLGLPAAAVGVVIAIGAVGVMLGAAITPRLARRVGSARVIWVSLAVTMPLTLLGAAARPGWLVGLLVLGAVAGELGQIVYAISALSVRQRLCPEGMLSRVNATMQVLIMGLFPLGAIVGGVLGETIGTRWTLVVSGVLLSVCPVVIAVALRGAREVEDLEPWEARTA
jgi:MFS family permease